MDLYDLGQVEFITDAAVPLMCLPPAFRHPLARQFEELDEDGDLQRSYDEWGLASVLAYAYTLRIEKKSEYSSMEMVIGECLEGSRHSPTENKELFKAIKRSVKAGDEDQTITLSKILMSKIGIALSEQHNTEDDDQDYEQD